MLDVLRVKTQRAIRQKTENPKLKNLEAWKEQAEWQLLLKPYKRQLLYRKQNPGGSFPKFSKWKIGKYSLWPLPIFQGVIAPNVRYHLDKHKADRFSQKRVVVIERLKEIAALLNSDFLPTEHGALFTCLGCSKDHRGTKEKLCEFLVLDFSGRKRHAYYQHANELRKDKHKNGRRFRRLEKSEALLRVAILLFDESWLVVGAFSARGRRDA
ncbi:MAG TPA: hypothetical protein VKS44_15700 [Candidatus Acidoferrales bacterium]|nr:hypothetical protein [Candidatus Acidoferrales bacterium]